MKFPEIETARLRLRPFGADDTDGLHRLWSAEGVRTYLWDDEVIPRGRTAAAVEQSLASFETNGYGLWAVSPRGEETLIGFCGFWLFHDPPRLQLLYGLAPSHWNRGLATEAAAAVVRYGFEELGFGRVEASADAPNAASIRVMEKLGMSFDKRVSEGGAETVFYSVTRESFRPGESFYLLRRASAPGGG